MDLLDFELKIGKRSGLDYPVEVVRSPAGEPEADPGFFCVKKRSHTSSEK